MMGQILQSSRTNILKTNKDIKNLWHPAMELAFETLYAKFEAFCCKFEKGVAFEGKRTFDLIFSRSCIQVQNPLYI